MAPPADSAPNTPALPAINREPAGEKPTPASKSRAKKKATKVAVREKRSRGWGPYKSVAKERSVDFNLTLDVQNLQQEIRELTTLRDLLLSQALNQRHERDGSLVKTVKEFYRLFHHGYWLDPSLGHGGRRNQHNYCYPQRLDTVQREFLESVMADAVDIGGGFAGVDLLIEQMAIYSTCFREFRVEMRHFDVVQAEDTVTITTHAAFHFRIAREMVELVFPHIAGNEALVSQLVGRRVVSDMRVTFSFVGGRSGGIGRVGGVHKVCVRYNVDVAFVLVFAGLLSDLRDTELLVRRARITPNSMLAVEPADSPIEARLMAL